MKSRVPWQVRGVLGLHRLAASLWKGTAILRDEVAWAWVKPENRQAVTNAIYEKDKGYSSGGTYFRQSLFDWEKKLLQAPFPSSGKILVGGAGGGREVSALLKRGYRVWAFDPVSTFVRDMELVGDGHEGLKVWQDSYENFSQNASTDSGNYFREHSIDDFDGVVLGWGSFSHLLSDSSRCDLLQVIRKIAPKAPVLLSFLTRNESQTSRWDRMRPFLRKSFRMMGARNQLKEGDTFYPGSGFVHLFSPEEILELASESGYHVFVFEKVPYPHALLLPNLPQLR